MTHALLLVAAMVMAVTTGQSSPPPVVEGVVFASALPDATLVLVRDAGHYPQVEQPGAFFSALEAFDRRVAARRQQR